MMSKFKIKLKLVICISAAQKRICGGNLGKDESGSWGSPIK